MRAFAISSMAGLVIPFMPAVQHVLNPDEQVCPCVCVCVCVCLCLRALCGVRVRGLCAGFVRACVCVCGEPFVKSFPVVACGAKESPSPKKFV